MKILGGGMCGVIRGVICGVRGVHNNGISKSQDQCSFTSALWDSFCMYERKNRRNIVRSPRDMAK